MIVLVAAVAENEALGKNGDLLWHLPDDFKHFKNLTSGHYIIMGRKTFESFPKPLPNRKHLVITRNENYSVPEDCIVVHSLDAALQLSREQENVYVIGGGEIFKEAMPIADKIELTRVHHSFDADAFFPVIDTSIWSLQTELTHPIDEKHAYTFSFQTWVRKK